MTPWSLIGRPAQGHGLHQDHGRSLRHATRSRGARRAPAARAPVPFASPLWRGGGVVFGPGPAISPRRSKKTRQLALRKALTERLKAGDVVIVDDLKLGSPKTKEFVGVLTTLEIERHRALRRSRRQDKNLTLASRNVPNIEVHHQRFVNTYQVLRRDKLVFTRGAFEKLEARLQGIT